MNVLITGASNGIGRELVKLFAKDKGNRVFAVARNYAALRELKQELRQFGGPEIDILEVDLTNSDTLINVVSKIEYDYTSLDVLINNAGTLVNKPFQEISSREVENTFRTNFYGPLELIQLLLPALKSSEGAHVINISSMGGFQGSSKFGGLSVYASSKAALQCLTEQLAEEYKETRVKFNCLALGAVQTEMLERAFPGYKANVSPKQMAEFIHNFALTGHKVFNGKILPVSLSTP